MRHASGVRPPTGKARKPWLKHIDGSFPVTVGLEGEAIPALMSFPLNETTVLDSGVAKRRLPGALFGGLCAARLLPTVRHSYVQGLRRNLSWCHLAGSTCNPQSGTQFPKAEEVLVSSGVKCECRVEGWDGPSVPSSHGSGTCSRSGCRGGQCFPGLEMGAGVSMAHSAGVSGASHSLLLEREE